MIEIYFDGACTPINPGGRCYGGAVILKNQKILTEISEEYIPEAKKRNIK